MHGKKKSKASALRGRSIDGIVGDGRRLGTVSATPFHPNADEPTSLLGGGLRPSEGFHPMRSGSGSLGVAATGTGADLALDGPIILDELDEAKDVPKPRRRLALKKWSLKRAALVLAALIITG